LRAGTICWRWSTPGSPRPSACRPGSGLECQPSASLSSGQRFAGALDPVRCQQTASGCALRRDLQPGGKPARSADTRRRRGDAQADRCNMPRPLSESRKPESRRKTAVLRGMRLRRIDSPPGFPGQPCAARERVPNAVRRVRVAYRNGENDAGTTRAFSCLMNMPRVAGGHAPVARASSRIRKRSAASL
jgi:hypothetical protein